MPPTAPPLLTPDALARDLLLRDLTDPAGGPHALQLLVDAASAALAEEWGGEVLVRRSSPVVPVEHNYDRLRYAVEAVARDARYTRYVSETCVLRTHTSALVPPALDELAQRYVRDVLLVCPGIVYRRDAIDRLHTGTPHQLDLWRVVAERMSAADLRRMVDVVVGALLPDHEHRTTPARHPYTEHGLQVDVRSGGEWVEVAECGVASPRVLAGAGLDTARLGGLAMGIGLDRVLMLRKGLPDIRLLRSDDPRVAAQMGDLSPYRAVSSHPAVRRDLSVAVDASATDESLGDAVRDALGDDASAVEAVQVVSETPASALPAAAAARLGIAEGQKNVLLSVVLRDLHRTLTDEEANALRDRVYAAVHRGAAQEWAAGGPSAPPRPTAP